MATMSLHGGKGNDQLFGNEFNDTFYGDEGDDDMHGMEGKDVFYDGPGNDEYWGEESSYTYTDDQDKFIFLHRSDMSTDRNFQDAINDYQSGHDYQIEVKAALDEDAAHPIHKMSLEPIPGQFGRLAAFWGEDAAGNASDKLYIKVYTPTSSQTVNEGDFII